MLNPGELEPVAGLGRPSRVHADEGAVRDAAVATLEPHKVVGHDDGVGVLPRPTPDIDHHNRGEQLTRLQLIDQAHALGEMPGCIDVGPGVFIDRPPLGVEAGGVNVSDDLVGGLISSESGEVLVQPVREVNDPAPSAPPPSSTIGRGGKGWRRHRQRRPGGNRAPSQQEPAAIEPLGRRMLMSKRLGEAHGATPSVGDSRRIRQPSGDAPKKPATGAACHRSPALMPLRRWRR